MFEEIEEVEQPDIINVICYDDRDIKDLIYKVVSDKKIRQFVIGFLKSNATCEDHSLTCGFYDVIANHSYAVNKESLDVESVLQLVRACTITFRFGVEKRTLYIKENEVSDHVIDGVLKDELYAYVESIVHFRDMELAEDLRDALKAIVNQFLLIIPHELEEKVSYNSMRLRMSLTTKGILELQ